MNAFLTDSRLFWRIVSKPSRYLIILLLALGACAHGAEDGSAVNDPMEPVNRITFRFNQGVDKLLLKPTAKAYRAVLPQPVRKSVTNVIGNAGSPVVFVNELFQLKFRRAEVTLARLLVNTTIGLGGIFDPATGLGLHAAKEDFGQTMGYYGIGDGPYVMLPLLGPSSPRDGIGRIVDLFLDPSGYLLSFELRTAITSTDVVDSRSRSIEILDQLEDTSLDFYAAVRSAYRQRRVYEIRDGQTSEVGADDLEIEGFIFGDEFLPEIEQETGLGDSSSAGADILGNQNEVD